MAQLGKQWNFEAKAKWNELSSGATIKGSVGDLIDEYLRLVSPTKAARTCLDHIDQSVWLKKVFGHMPADGVKPSHVARYLDTRCSKDGNSAPVRQTERLHCFPVFIPGPCAEVSPR
ncbi:MAG: hypothetical protein ACYCY0_01120 [Acidithiobacillus ferrivorans]